jgi:hypothetical protein
MSMVAARVKCPETRVTVGNSLESAAEIRVKCFMIARSLLIFNLADQIGGLASPMKRMNKDWIPLEG